VIVISDASPLIALSAVGRLDLLQQLYTEILIPAFVAEEILRGTPEQPGAVEVGAADWIGVRAVSDSGLVRLLEQELDRGEAEAIALAVEIGADLLVADEHRARRVAARLDVEVIGVLGILVEAKRNGLIPAVRPILDELTTTAGFRVNRDLYLRILQAADE
jgi:uncharacterized protein